MIRKGEIVTEKEIPSRQAADLRRQAENIVREKTIRIPENINALSPEETRQTLHELQVHQIELEIQNEELRRTQMELDAARAKYFDLYDLAPIGYVTINEKGQIVEANLAAATLLGAARGNLLKQLFSRFVHPEDQDIYYHTRKRLFKDPSPISLQADQAGETQVTLELRMEKMDRMAFWAHMEATAALDDDGAPLCRIVIVDITNRKKAEEDLKLFKSIVEKSSEAIAISNSGGVLDFYQSCSRETLCPIIGSGSAT